MPKIDERVARLEERLDGLCKDVDRCLGTDEECEMRLRKLEYELAILKTERDKIVVLRKKVNVLEAKVRRNTLYLSVAQVILAFLGKFIPADFVLGG
jgi:hypothetical protein